MVFGFLQPEILVISISSVFFDEFCNTEILCRQGFWLVDDGCLKCPCRIFHILFRNIFDREISVLCKVELDRVGNSFLAEEDICAAA